MDQLIGKVNNMCEGFRRRENPVEEVALKVVGKTWAWLRCPMMPNLAEPQRPGESATPSTRAVI